MKYNVSKEKIMLILDYASDLFAEKGFDKTSIQDIQDGLGLSRGAIYHHFKSKDEILLAVFEREHDVFTRELKEFISDVQGETGLEKLRAIMNALLFDVKGKKMNSFFKEQTSNSDFIVKSITTAINEDSQLFLPLIEEGITDGSIQTKYPKEICQLLMLYLNLWLNGQLFPMTIEDLKARVTVIRLSFNGLGLELFNDQFMDELLRKMKGGNDEEEE